MKILLINNFHYIKGGSEAVYFNMARMFTAMGHQVVFFSCKSSRNTEYGSNGYFIESNSDINPILGAARYIYNGKAKRALQQLITEFRPDIAHIHLFWGGLSSSILGVLKQNRIPIVHTVHDYRFICPAYLLRRPDNTICSKCIGGNFLHCITNRCSKGKLSQSLIMAIESYFRKWFIRPLAKIDGYIFVSRFSHDKHLQSLPELRNKRVMVAYNAVDTEVVKSTNSIGDYYLYFGRLSPEKGLVTLINAFNDLEHLQLKVVGEGAMLGQLQSIAGKNVEFCGYLCGEELDKVVRGCKAIIVPSEWYENNPMSIIEATAAGIPAIGAQIGGIPEIVIDGKTGYSFTAGDAEALKAAVNRFEALSKDEQRAMKIACREFACQNFATTKLYERIIEFYTSIIESYE